MAAKFNLNEDETLNSLSTKIRSALDTLNPQEKNTAESMALFLWPRTLFICI